MSLEDFQLFLPKYLSPESQRELLKELKNFPENIDSRLYTSRLDDEEIIFQGDGLDNLLIINLPEDAVRMAKGIVISNTCDIDPKNPRFVASRLCYAPILSFEKYIRSLEEERASKEISIDEIKDHADAIRKQRVTQIFFLPKTGELEDSVVLLDRILNCDNNYVNREKLKGKRLFTLSDYGIYLFIFKLSLHFTRMQESIERGCQTSLTS